MDTKLVSVLKFKMSHQLCIFIKNAKIMTLWSSAVRQVAQKAKLTPNEVLKANSNFLQTELDVEKIQV